jgi:hypothetical protein
VHLRKTSPCKRVVSEALTHRGFSAWTAAPHLPVSYRNPDGLVVEISSN